jgi:hypothetical protein
LSWVCTHAGGPVGGGLVVAEVDALLEGLGELDAGVETGVDDGAAVDTGADDDTGTLTDADVGGADELTGGLTVAPPDDVHATALAATATRAAATSARLNCRSASRSNTAGSSA